MDRRTFLAGAASIAAANLVGQLGCASIAAAQHWHRKVVPHTLDVLIALDDTPVRDYVGTVFLNYLRASPDVRAVFFPRAQGPAYPGPGVALVDEVAVALVCWSLSQTSAHGFARTVDGNQARATVERRLSPNDGEFQVVALQIYESLFPDLCSADGADFRDFLVSREVWGKPFAETLSSDAFFTKTMGRFTGNPGGFTQYVDMQVYKAEQLAGGTPEMEAVRKRWDPYKGPWTVYERMQASSFSDQTFMPEVQAAIGQPTKTGRRAVDQFCQPSSGQCRTIYEDVYTYGIAVANWLNEKRGRFGQLVTNNAPDNGS
jgi:hypothetical protein